MRAAENLLQNLQSIPSVFEISTAENLDQLIYPAIKKITSFFDSYLNKLKQCTSKCKRFLAHCVVYLPPACTWCLQYFHLRKRNASFGESVYSMQRTTLNSDAALNIYQQLISASLLTAMPCMEDYLKTKDQHHNIGKWQRYLLKLIHVYNAYRYLHLLMYLVKFTSSHSPILFLLNLSLRYPYSLKLNRDVATNVLLKFVELFSFFLQFVQWWYASDKSRKVGGSLINPPPASNIVNDSLVGLCPICHESIENPTASAVTGYVYCWKCIVNHLSTSQECPVSKCGMTIDDLIRLHED